MQQYANYVGSEHQTQGPSAVHEPQIIRNVSIQIPGDLFVLLLLLFSQY